MWTTDALFLLQWQTETWLVRARYETWRWPLTTRGSFSDCWIWLNSQQRTETQYTAVIIRSARGYGCFKQADGASLISNLSDSEVAFCRTGSEKIWRIKRSPRCRAFTFQPPSVSVVRPRPTGTKAALPGRTHVSQRRPAAKPVITVSYKTRETTPRVHWSDFLTCSKDLSNVSSRKLWNSSLVVLL